jgi:lipopolysaccharide/colanic/teichoic acid biosynthesis glycosyltransferase
MRAVVVAEPVEPAAYFRWNWLLNRFLGAVLLVIAAPVILVCLVAVMLTSPGAPLYRQKRVGKGGRLFTIYKIRTMRLDAEKGTGPVWTTTNRDPRITRIGRFFRGTHLDELPQLLNVVAGEMSLVGPRPERPEFAEALADEIPGYLNRLHVLPGVTGLAQVNLPPDTDFDSVRRKLVLDLKYIAEGSLWLDIRLMIATLAPLMGIPGRWANRPLKVDYGTDITRLVKRTDEQSVKHSEQHADIVSAMSPSR